MQVMILEQLINIKQTLRLLRDETIPKRRLSNLTLSIHETPFNEINGKLKSLSFTQNAITFPICILKKCALLQSA